VISYQASDARKAELLAEYRSCGSFPPLESAQDAAALNAWSDAWGFPQALVHLAAALAAPFATEGADRTFIGELLDAVPVGADLTGAAHRWLGWLWQGEPGIASQVTDTSVKDSATDIVVLHGRVAEGEAIPTPAWRHARRGLQMALGGTTTETVSDAASIVAASAWDYQSTPGAAADVLVAWERAVRAAIRRADGGSDEEDRRYAEMRAEARKLARASMPDSEISLRLMSETNRLLAERAGELGIRMTARTKAMVHKTVAVRNLGKASLVNLLRAHAG
jgi:hypothetical protein